MTNEKAQRAAYMREWRARPENIDKVRQRSVDRYHRNRKEVHDLLGNRCARCGFSDERALEIDHIVPVGHPAGARQWFREMVKVRANPEEYQLLCANCHTIKSKGER